MTCNNPNVDLVNINAYIKFGEILSIYFQDIDVRKMMCNNPKVDIGILGQVWYLIVSIPDLCTIT